MNYQCWIDLREGLTLGKKVFFPVRPMMGDDFNAAAHVPSGPICCLVEKVGFYENDGACTEPTVSLELDPAADNGHTRVVEDALRSGGWSERQV